MHSRLRPALVLACLCFASRPASAGDDLVLDLGRGPVTVHVPDLYDGSTPAPLVLLLHGYGASGATQEAYFQLLPESEEHGFLYLYPNGTQDSSGQRFWNATDACCNFFGSPVDDSGYLRALIEAVKELLVVDERRVYIVGHSNGGFMAYRMACEHADTVAAVASLAGATWFDTADCTPSEPVHVLQIHGTADNTILFDGGSLVGNPYPSALGTAERWATYAGCTLVQDTSAPNINLVQNIPGMESTVTRWIDACSAGGSAELWTIPGGEHVPNLSNPFAGLVVDWLLAHPQPGLGTNDCSSTPNSTGAAALIQASGSSSVADNDFELFAGPVPVGVPGLFYYGPEAASVPFGNGLRCIAGGQIGLFRLDVLSASAQGELHQAVDLTAPPSPAGQIQAGSTWRFQAWFRDPAAGGAAFDLSDAVAVTFGV